MKYNININQKALSELSSDMDVFDASILVYIKDICGSGNEKINNKRFTDENGNVWTWVDLQTLCDDMPLLRIKARGAITRRIQRIERNGFIETKQNMVNGHTRLFIRAKNKVDDLTFTDINVDKSTLTDINVDKSTLTDINEHVDGYQRDSKKHVDEYQPIIDTSNIIHNNTIDSVRKRRKTEEPMDSIRLNYFNSFWAAFPVKKGKQKAEEKWKDIDPAIMPMIIEDVKSKASRDRQWLEGFAPQPPTYLNQKRWTDEIELPIQNGPKLALGNTYTKGKMENLRKHTF